MWIYVNTEVLEELGTTKAILVEHLFMRTQHYNIKAKLNVSELSRTLPISLSTAQRLLKELSESGYITKYSNNEYSLSKKFYDTFAEYNNYIKNDLQRLDERAREQKFVRG
jgi:DNA-binding IclR family transcriptional regulator